MKYLIRNRKKISHAEDWHEKTIQMLKAFIENTSAKAAHSYGILTRVGGFIKKNKSSGRDKVSNLGNAAKINVNDI